MASAASDLALAGSTARSRNSAPSCTCGPTICTCVLPPLVVANTRPLPSGFILSTSAWRKRDRCAVRPCGGDGEEPLCRAPFNSDRLLAPLSFAVIYVLTCIADAPHLEALHLGLQVQVEGAHLRLQVPHQPIHLCTQHARLLQMIPQAARMCA